MKEKLEKLKELITKAESITDEVGQNPEYLVFDLSEKLKDCQYIINKLEENDNIKSI